WDIRRVRQRCAGCPDPVLCLSEFAGRRMVTADTGHKLRVKISSEAKRQLYRLETVAPVLEGDHVLRHFAEIRRAPFYCCTHLRSEQLSEGRLGAFDPTRQHRFALNEWPDKEMRVRKPPSFTSKTADETIRVS